jgi:hypothetical protein
MAVLNSRLFGKTKAKQILVAVGAISHLHLSTQEL